MLVILAWAVAADTCYDMVMEDSYGDGWDAVYTVTNRTGAVVASGTCSGISQADTVCLDDGCYALEVSDDEFASEVSWTFGAFSGSAPFGPQYFTTDGLKGCAEANCVLMNMTDTYGDGWDTGYYEITQYGAVVATGTLEDGVYDMDTVCLAPGCYELQVYNSTYNSEVGWTLLGESGTLYAGSAPFVGYLIATVSSVESQEYACPTLAPVIVPDTPSPTEEIDWQSASTFADLTSIVSTSDAVVHVEVTGDISWTSTVSVAAGQRRVFGSTEAVSSRRRLSSSSTTMDGGGSTQFFDVDGGDVIVRGPIVLANCYGALGGVAYVENSGSLTLTDVTVTNCRADSGAVAYLFESFAYLTGVVAFENFADDFGAVLYMETSEAVISGGTYSNNSAYACGAFYNRKSRLAIQGALLDSNAADTFGGVACSYYTTFNDAVTDAQTYFADCHISKNVAGWHGGVSYNNIAVVIFENSTVHDNLAHIDGGVAQEDFGAQLVLSTGAFERNVALGDGGVAHTVDLYVGDLAIWQAYVGDNRALGNGGVVSVSFHASSPGTFEISGGVFSGNSADEGGVARVSNGPLSAHDARFTGCSAEYGGVIYASLAALNLNKSIFEANNATFGGVVAVDEAREAVVFRDCTAQANEASAQGGVVYCGKSLCDINGTGTSFEWNRAVEGSAVYVPAFAKSALVDLVLVGNVAVFSGALYVGLSSATTVSNVTSRDNVAFDSGAFAYCAALASVTLSHVTSQGDVASLNGVVYAGTRSNVEIADATFLDSRTSRGAVYATAASSLSVRRSVFLRCQALEVGAAIFAQSVDDLAVSEVSIFENSAVEAAAVYVDAGTAVQAAALFENVVAAANAAMDGAVLVAMGSTLSVSLEGCKATANTATSTAGVAVARDGTTVVVTGSTISDNIAASSAGAFALDTNARLVVTSTQISGNLVTAGSGGVFTLENGAQVDLVSAQISANQASLGGGGVVYFDHTTATIPTTFTNGSTTVVFANNSALYGNVAASNTASIRVGHDADHEASGFAFETPLYVVALDALDQIVRTQTTERVLLSTPFTLNSSLAGNLKLSFSDGVASTANNTFLIKTDAEDASVPVAASLHLSYATYEDTLKILLRACVAGEHWNGDGDFCETCPVDTYSFRPEDSCVECEDRSHCPGGYALKTDRGFWRSTKFSTNVRRCLMEDHCKGGVDLWSASTSDGDNLICAKHHYGPLCAVCENGYALNSNQDCVVCRTTDTTWKAIGIFFAIVVVAAVAIAALAYVFYVARKDLVLKGVAAVKKAYNTVANSSLCSWTKFKLLVIHWQTVTAQIMVFNFVKYPSSASALRIIGFDLVAILSMGFCRSDYLRKLWAVTVLPVFVVLVILARHVVKWYRLSGDPGRRHALYSQTVTLLLTVTFVVYTTVSAGIFGSLRCDSNFGGQEPKGSRYRGQSYLIADYSIRCGSTRFKLHEIYAYLMVLVYPIGCPLLYVAILANQLDHVNPRPSRVRKIADDIIRSDDTGTYDQTDRRMSYSPCYRQPDQRQRQRPPKEMVQLAREYVAIVDHVGLDAIPARNTGARLVVMHRVANCEIRPLKILYHDYQPRYWYFEAIMCVCRLLLTCVLPTWVHNQLGLLYSTTLMTLAYCILIITVQPYAEQSTNVTSSFLAATATFTMTLTVWVYVESNFKNDDVSAGWSTAVLGNFLVFINFSMGPLSLFIDVGLEFDAISLIIGAILGLASLRLLLARKIRRHEIEESTRRRIYAAVAPEPTTSDDEPSSPWKEAPAPAAIELVPPPPRSPQETTNFIPKEGS